VGAEVQQRVWVCAGAEENQVHKGARFRGSEVQRCRGSEVLSTELVLRFR
jgi:hypothetical protein